MKVLQITKNKSNDNGRARAIGEVEKIIDYICQGSIDDFEI